MKKILSLTLLLGVLALLATLLVGNLPVQAASDDSFSGAKGSNPEQTGPPWFDAAWHYRRPVKITSAASLPYYQVLIKLDINNFDFSRADENGADIRFTHSDGTTELKYWREVWDSADHLAYVWVRVPSVANGETTIYIYYGNEAATSASDGNATFDGFDDDWEQFSGEGKQGTGLQPYSQPYSPFDWSVIGATPTASAGILSLGDGSGIKSVTTYQFQAVGMKANYGLSSVDEWIGFINGTSGQRTLISDNKPGNLNDLFLLDSVNGVDFEYVVLPKVGGQNWHGDFHTYELRWTSGQSSADIEHGSSEASSTIPGLVPGNPLPITLYNDTISNGSLLVDWVYVRQYHDPEPTAAVMGEQGLVKLSIGMTDSPDPVRRGVSVTYQLTISNTSSINAPGVVVTDTLPADVELISVEASQGNCEPGTIILCDLQTINANSEALVSVVMNITKEEKVTNLAAVGSPGYELDLSDNYREETTQADWTVPVVNWERPSKNGGLFLTFGGYVTLEASATDAGGIERVEFRYWNHKENEWVTIGSAYTYPFQVQFDSNVLGVNDPYQVFVVAADRAGNVSDPYNPLQRIFIERRLPVFIPVLRK
jgi:uncharacterized repeat protein (TIGR01451 family)